MVSTRQFKVDPEESSSNQIKPFIMIKNDGYIRVGKDYQVTISKNVGNKF